MSDNSPQGSDIFTLAGEVTHYTGHYLWARYAKDIRGGATSFTININDTVRVWVIEVSGLDKQEPLIDSTSTETRESVTVAQGSPLLTEFTSGIIFSLMQSSGGLTAIKSGNPFTSVGIMDDNDIAYYKFSGVGSYWPEWTQGSGDWSSISLAFKAPGATSAMSASSPQLVRTVNANADTQVLHTTSAFQVAAGDLLVAYSAAEDSVLDLGTPTGGGLTWTAINTIDANGYGEIRAWYAVASATKAISSLSFTSTSSQHYISTVMIFRNTSGVGASNKANTTGVPSLSLTTTKANSSVIVLNVDWNVVNGSSRSWLTSPGTFYENVYLFLTGAWTVYGGFFPDVGAIGSKTVGLSAPGGQQYSIMAIEIKGP
jgi:hypothetical protein